MLIIRIIHLLDCSNADVRLVAVGNPVEGRLEVCYDGVWGTICNRNFNLLDARVACRSLGYTRSGQ